VNGESLYEFHFKGYLKGERVNKIEFKFDDGAFIVKDDYLIALNVDEIKKGTLIGSLLKYKKI
jgi:hypothetical protein